MSDRPIADYGLLSDCHTAALVGRDGSVDWLCLPRFDSPSVFGRLLDDRAGHWSILPVGPAEVSRRYLDQTLVLETTFRVAGGVLVLTDALSLGAGERGHQLGSGSPHVLLRRASCPAGEVEVELEWAPRPGYGQGLPSLQALGEGVVARGEAELLTLASAVPLVVEGSTARARFTLRAGEAREFATQHGGPNDGAPRPWPAEAIAGRSAGTAETWRTWSSLHQRYEGPWRDLVRHSGRVLRALTYQPTGAIVAAATTSLPEVAGGERNWDYRYTWVRDASFTLEALWVAACPDEAHAFFSFLAGTAADQVRRTGDLQIMFGITGEQVLTEHELSHLSGWRGSRPVRVGNGAFDQRQIDVYGELLGAAWRLADQRPGPDRRTRRFLADVADLAVARWREPDLGIWEVRGGSQHYLYSKLMCWVALDRAIAMAKRLGARRRVRRWARVKDEIRQAILDQAWSDRAGAFTQAFGSEALDGSALAMPLVGFLPATEPRMRATIEAVADRLTDERGLVYRYRADDGLAGEEGTFLLCTFWLAEALALAGEPDRAAETFEAASGYTSDLGLLAEEVDPSSGELLGNYPQAFIGLVNAAWAISQARTTH